MIAPPSKLRRNKATTFQPAIPKAVFDLQHHFVFSKQKAPIDGIEAIKRDGAVVSEHSVIKYVNDERPDESVDDNLNDTFKTVLRVGIGMRTGLVADKRTMEITGVLSVTDFIMVLMMLWKYRENLDELKGTPLSHEDFRRMDIAFMPIIKWKECLFSNGQLKPFIKIGLKESIFHAVELLAQYRIHRLPVMDEDTGDCAYILTHRRILHYIWKHLALLPKPSFLNEKITKLSMGSWQNLIYATEETPLIDCLDMLINNQISGIPIVEADTLKVVEVYTRFDAASAAFLNHIDLSVPVMQSIAERDKICGIRRDGVVTAHYSSTFWQLIECFINKNVHRIFLVDSNNVLKGIISLSDVTEFMILRPPKSREQTPQR
ncbi:unnamed protein product [Caenorhabditis bovis]|uniref:CBS domain-containing protein n=1 Tax=Caenorhabditis bovis TaxID=2654633 RepID=A0A8S1EG80_9PELO|nr:unnamed protein product [Caenorhabditis bovis]